MKHQDKESWYQCAFRRLAFSTGSGSCQSTHFNPLNVRIEWMWEANGSWVFRWKRNLDTFLSWIFSNHWSFPRLHHGKTHFSRPYLWNCGQVAGPPTASSMDPHPIHTQRIPKGRLHVNASNSIHSTMSWNQKRNASGHFWALQTDSKKNPLPTFPATSAPSQHHRCPVPLHPAFDLVGHWKKSLEADLYNESLLLMLSPMLYQLGNYNSNYKPPNVDHPSAMIRHWDGPPLMNWSLCSKLMLPDDHMTMDTMDNTQVTGPKLPPKKCHPGSPPFDPFLQGDHISWPHLSQKKSDRSTVCSALECYQSMIWRITPHSNSWHCRF